MNAGSSKSEAPILPPFVPVLILTLPSASLLLSKVKCAVLYVQDWAPLPLNMYFVALNVVVVRRSQIRGQ